MPFIDENSSLNILRGGWLTAACAGWTLSNVSAVAASEGTATLTASAAGGSISQALHNLELGRYTVSLWVNGGPITVSFGDQAKTINTAALKRCTFSVTITTTSALFTVAITNNGGAATLGRLAVFAGVNANSFTSNPIDNCGAYELPDALLISHFDGFAPYTSDNSGNPNGHKGQIPALSGGIIYRPGRFGKAVQVAEATTNLVPNPSFEANITDGWTNSNLTFTQDSSASVYGSYSLKQASASISGVAEFSTTTVSVTPGSTYTLSFWLKKEVATGTGLVELYFMDSGSNFVAYDNLALDSGAHDWKRYVKTFTAAAGVARVDIYFTTGGATAGTAWTVYYDAVQLETKAYPTPYCDGSLGVGHSWSGTAHNSASSRVATNISYPATYQVAPITAGTWSCWLYADWNQTDSISHIPVSQMFGASDSFDINKYSDNKLYAGWIVGGTDRRVIVDSADYSLPSSTWNMLTVTWDTATGVTCLYINGILKGSSTGLTATSGARAACYLGSFQGASSNWWNGLIDDLCVLPRTLSAAEVSALYSCSMPASAGGTSGLDTVRVYAKYSTAAGQSIPNNAWTVIDYGTMVSDSHGAVATGSGWYFFVPVAGIYNISATMLFTGTTTWADGESADLGVFVNGNQVWELDRDDEMSNATQYKELSGSCSLFLNAGDRVDIRVLQLSGGALALHTGAVNNQVAIVRVA